MRKNRWALFLALVLLPLVALAAGPPTTEAVDVWSTGKGTSSNILSRDLTPSTTAAAAGVNAYDCTYRVTIALVTTNSILDLHVTRTSDSSTQDFKLNTGTTLTAGVLYPFTFGAVAGYTYNLRVETATTIGYCVVERLGY